MIFKKRVIELDANKREKARLKKGLPSALKKLLGFVIVSAVYLLVYRIAYAVPKATGAYLPFGSVEWIYHNSRQHLLPYAITVVPVFFGKYLYSAVNCSGFVLGILLGELFGKPPVRSPEDVTWLHYGWAIWLCTFIVSIIVGIIVEVLSRKRKRG